MTRFVVDAGVVLRLAAEAPALPAHHRLVAPTLLRSQTLSLLHEAVHRGDLSETTARERLERVDALAIRLLGDRVLRHRAWDLATRLGVAGTQEAEYLALTQLQADAFVTLDPDLARQAAIVVTTAPYEALTRP